MKELNKKKALKIATKYLLDKISRQLAFIDNPPDVIYSAEKVTDCWCLHVPDSIEHIGAGRMICISKHTGKIVFDGYVGE